MAKIGQDDLSNRERQVLHLLAFGYTNNQIGATLNIEVNTVKTHLKNIYRKLQVNNRTQAALKHNGAAS